MKVKIVIGRARKRIKVGRRWGRTVSLTLGSPDIDCGGRFDVAKGATNMAMKVTMVAVMKKPNMTWDAIRTSFRALVTSTGRATAIWLQISHGQ